MQETITTSHEAAASSPSVGGRRITSSYGPIVNARALLSLLDKENASGLPEASKKLVIDSLAAAAEPSALDRETSRSGRHAYRAAIAWLRHAPGRVIRALNAASVRSRPGAYDLRRPRAKPFRPSRAWQLARFTARAVASASS